MAYQLITGHRLEDLVGSRVGAFRSGFFGPRPVVVVQNQSLAQWLKLFLARTTGGYATGDFVFQDEMLRRLIALAGTGADRILFLDDLKLELYRRLSNLLAAPGPDPVFAPLAGREGTPDPVRLFELADHISGVFHNYAMNSALWPGALTAGEFPVGSTADPAAFAWQARLWQDLWADDRGTLAGLVLERLTRQPPAVSGPAVQVVLVGSAFLSRRAAAFLRSWSEAGLVDVLHLLLLPAPAPSASPWPDRRPWSSWGTFGQAFLGALPAVQATAPAPGSGDSPSALGLLQGALARGLRFPGAPADGTLEVVSAPHPLRELEVLRDRILAALAADPTLEVHEIAVLAPDINVYAPFLDAAFGSDDPGRNLRYHVIDLDLGRENAWFRALDALLALVSGTVDRPTLFTLVDTPAFREAWDLEEDDRDLWLDYTEEVSAWREEPWTDGGPQTWSASWDRLFSGWFREEGAPVGASLPLTTAPSAFRTLGRFHQLVSDLRTRASETRRERSFSEWIRFFDQTVSEFLAPGDGTGAVLSGRLRTLAADAGNPADALPWSGFRAFVQDQIAHFPGRRGQLLTEGVHCSSLRPLRAIPFRFIAVLGLDEGRFPRQSPAPSFDLMRHEPGQDRVSGLALDRYCFWETLMAARDRLHLSYQGRSPVDGTERPPSPVLADLLDLLEEGGKAWEVTLASVKDFSAAPGSGDTWSPRTRRRALAAQGRPPERSDPGTPLPVPPLEETFPEVRSSEVVQAFVTPARFHLKRVRQVVLRAEDRRGVDDEEPWSLGFLDRQAWLQEGLRRHLAGQEFAWDVGAFIDRALATGLVREGAFTDRDRQDLTVRAGKVAAWADTLAAEGWAPDEGHQPGRTRWAGRPWAWESDGRLVRNRDILVPRLLYSEGLPVRLKFEIALRLLQDPGPTAVLAALSPQGQTLRLTWGPDRDRTEDLARTAELWWAEAAARPLPLYPDYVETLAKRRADRPDEGWSEAVEAAWHQARDPGAFTVSEATLARDPYAALAFPGDEVPPNLAETTKRWWDNLLVPLLEVWK